MHLKGLAHCKDVNLKLGATEYYKRTAGQLIYGKQNFLNKAIAIIPKEFNGKCSSKMVPSFNIKYGDPNFLYYNITRDAFLKSKEMHANGTGSKLVTEKAILTFEIIFPSLEEQQKIGNFFKDVDNKITSLQNTLSITKELKRTLISKLLVVKNGEQPELRFPEFYVPWVKNKVNHIFDEITRGEVLPMNKIKELPTTEYKYPVYSSKITNYGIAGYYNQYLFENSITWATDGAYAGTVAFRKGKFFSTNINGVLLSNKGYSNTAMAEILNLVTYKHVSRADNLKLMNTTMAEILIFYPSEISEQHQISSFLTEIDNLVFTYERAIENHKTLKQALLQRMFV
ncbi:restriction endonuclease subunit S [Psittacicella melopsittaci]|uniref:restriction endonuclease subunit S n=1 Tax=Psittacicella melopsittaci TaxID=2028576 RepID=UPI0011C3501E|nr:restriction endonuclease subunit S [Psittacicella melopsittaci]